MAGAGQPKTGGRQKGTPKKITAALKEAIEVAFDEVGGKDYLVEVARSDPKVFCTLLGKLVPTQLRAELEDGGLTVVTIRDYTGREHERGPRVVTPALGPGTVQDDPVEPGAERVIPDHGMPPEEDELEPIPKRKPLTPAEGAALGQRVRTFGSSSGLP